VHPSLFDTNIDDHGGFRGGPRHDDHDHVTDRQERPASLPLWTTAEPSSG
jgi:hypothetical protein